jgi:hypothetical protein
VGEIRFSEAYYHPYQSPSATIKGINGGIIVKGIRQIPSLSLDDKNYPGLLSLHILCGHFA